MKIITKYLCVAILAIVTLSACGTSSDKKNKEQETSLPSKLETVSLNIEGMTCEIGCAKTIESKISKLEGVEESKVDFESKNGTFTYDANKTSEATIIGVINGLLDGKTYSASVSKTCCANKEAKVCTEACAKKCGHKIGETCNKCESNNKEACCKLEHKKSCDKACEEKCEHKEEVSCKPNCEKPCCSTKNE